MLGTHHFQAPFPSTYIINNKHFSPKATTYILRMPSLEGFTMLKAHLLNIKKNFHAYMVLVDYIVEMIVVIPIIIRFV